MTAKEYTEGSVIIEAGSPVDHIALISKGSISVALPNGEIILEKGDVIGLADICFDTYSSSYTTLEDSTLLIYSCANEDDLSELVHTNKDLALLFTSSIIKQTCNILDIYVLFLFSSDNLYNYLFSSNEEYKNLCRQYKLPPKSLEGLDELEVLLLEDKIEDWQTEYYESMQRLEPSIKAPLFQDNPAICIGFLLKACLDIHHVFEICETVLAYKETVSAFLLSQENPDLFSFLTELYCKALKLKKDCLPIEDMLDNFILEMECNPCISAVYRESRIKELQNLLENGTPEKSAKITTEIPVSTLPASRISSLTELNGSLNTLLCYAGSDEETATLFLAKIGEFRQITDKNSDEPHVQKLRKELTTLFYQLYTSVFHISTTDKNIPTIVKMFLNFGYVDEVIAGAANAAYLYSIADDYHGNPEQGIYTIYEWLLAMCTGKKEPSRNEFDVDYTAYVHEKKINKQISAAAEQELLNDNSQRTKYELENMFPIVNKITVGRISSYCPVLCEQNILKSLDDIIVKPSDITEALNTIRALDYSAFYRESIYTNSACGITKEFLHTEILPDIILMPNIGTRGVMWQEIEGKRRSTPARMMISAFSINDVKTLLVQLTGTYRWEMCKRVQGARWNDVSDPSLTSAYCDYAQFYRKNYELSAQAKEQIKSNLAKAKNNYRELFIRDYILWIFFEGNASPRLNKVVRNILFTYCPFSSDIRERLSTNPLYTDLVSRYNIKKLQRITHIHNVVKKLVSSGFNVPDEIRNQEEFLNK